MKKKTKSLGHKSRFGDAFRRAIALHEQGKIGEAKSAYTQLLLVDPSNTAVLNNVAMIAFQQGCFDEGVRLIERSLAVNPNQAQSYYNLGNAVAAIGLYADSIPFFEKALELAPEYAEANYSLGNALYALQRYESAVVSYQRAIVLRPEFINAYYNMGNALYESECFAEAVSAYGHAVAINPGYVNAYFNQGQAFKALKRYSEALECNEKIVELQPGYVPAHYSIGVLLSALGRNEEAIASTEKVICLDPGHFEAQNNLGVLHQQCGRAEVALQAYDRAIALKPDYAEAYFNRGIALKKLMRYEEALSSYDQAVALKTDFAEVYYNRGILLREMERYDEAIKSYDQAISIRPEYSDAQWNKSLLQLMLGRFEEGWKSYEFRWRMGSNLFPYRPLDKPLWLGHESLENKTLLVYPEQGLGDVLQYCRYIPMVADVSQKVVVEVPPALLTIISTLDKRVDFIPSGSSLPNFDYQIPIMSLPLAFKTTVETIPAKIPYLFADQNKVQYWREKIGIHSKPRVGLVWSGGFRPDYPETWETNGRRNIQLRLLESFGEVDADFYSLQKGQPGEAELDEIKLSGWNGPDIVNYVSELHDFSDTAALIVNLDLIITVDTSVVHLAGALGAPVWVMNRYDACWRWLKDRADSPWYSNIRLFNQPGPGEWQAVVRSIQNELVKFSQSFKVAK